MYIIIGLCNKFILKFYGVSYTGSTPALGAGRLGSIPSTPTKGHKTLNSMQPTLQVLKIYYLDNLPWFKKVLVIFGVGIALGVLVAMVYPQLMDRILEVFEDRFGQELETDFGLAMEIFKQNVTASLISLAAGLFFGIGAVLAMLINGFILGFIVTFFLFNFSETFLSNIYFIIVGILPHGVVELPVFIFTAALAYRLGTEWIGKPAGERLNAFRHSLVNVLKWLPAMVLLLLLAAIVEVFISGKLISDY